MIEKLIAKQRGTRLKKELKSRGIKQREAAEILGISLSGLSYLISGRSMISRVLSYAIEFKIGISSEYILNGTKQHVIEKNQHNEIMRQLAELKEMAWSKETQEQLLETMTEMSEVMAKQTLVYEQQAKIFERMEKYLADEYEEPEPEPMVS
jgi:transcriptional regulator with XRE-family HTH domain